MPVGGGAGGCRTPVLKRRFGCLAGASPSGSALRLRDLDLNFVQLEALGVVACLLFERVASCVYATLTSSFLQVEVLGAVALRYRLACLVDCANDPFVVALLE